MDHDEALENRNKEIEVEQLYVDDEEGVITEPFNPKDVDIISQPMVISNIVDDLKDGSDIILDPDFQRFPDLWDEQKQSRLIESLIIRIPLPAFYFDAGSKDDKLIVVDGLQRLNAIRRFMSLKEDDPRRLVLKGLEYLPEYNGCSFETLPGNIQKRIRSQVITAYVIRPGTPDKVRTSIFTRINTGGMTLEPAEIKNSVYRGQAADLLKELARSEEFVRATRKKIDPRRMLDCEFVNRFLAFYLLGVEKYAGNLEDFAKRLLRCPYLVGIINSLPYNSHERKFIRRVRENGLIEIVLPWTDKGYGMVVKTTGRTIRETERIAEIIEEEFGYIL